ncbi:MAG: acetyl/propionyl/methylcrotonyl-CoA carboxylase subunit alpha, partial [Planctomycetota bacterium]
KSYLDISKIISAAEITDADAIHPGYGFLAESEEFAQICRDCGIRFIGPSPEILTLFGNKIRAKEIAARAGVPVLESSGELTTLEDAIKFANSICYPVMLKSVYGGGGRGIRLAQNDITLANIFLSAQMEAKNSFKNGALFLEKQIPSAKHIEVQVLADNYGNYIHLGERDCSIQRRFQKFIEEAPSPVIDGQMREIIGEYALAIVKMAGLTCAATVEFLFEPHEKKVFFIEVNPRIQVEHPVTEMITGIDIVKEQILITAGEKLSFSQDDIELNGTAIECRVLAEDPAENFKPSPGTITKFFIPGGLGIRCDSACTSGVKISPYYDSLIAKVITHRNTRLEAISAMKATLQLTTIEGIRTNINYLLSILNHHAFIKAQMDTNFVENYFTFR